MSDRILPFFLLLDVVGAFTYNILNKSPQADSFLFLLQLNCGCSSWLIRNQTSREKIRAFSNVYLSEFRLHNTIFYVHSANICIMMCHLPDVLSVELFPKNKCYYYYVIIMLLKKKKSLDEFPSILQHV